MMIVKYNKIILRILYLPNMNMKKLRKNLDIYYYVNLDQSNSDFHQWIILFKIYD